MKFLFVIDNLSTGGAQRQMVNLAVGLTNRGHQIHVFCYSPGDKLAQPLHDAKIPIDFYEKHSRYPFDAIFALRKLIQAQSCDLILSYLRTPNFLALVSSKLTGNSQTPVVISERFCDLTQYMTWTERIIRQSYRFANHLVVNSFHQQANFIHKYSWLQNRISTIYNGYDLQVFVPPNSEPQNQVLRILAIASVSPYKNGLCLIEALKILRHKYRLCPEVSWIGERVLRGDRLNYLNAMEQAIKSYGLETQWHWLDQRSDIVEQLHQHDCLVHPSYGEGLPNVVCEALACARPVIVSDILDHPKLVQHGISGYLFDWRNPDDLANKIILFCGLSLEQRRKMGQHGREFAEEYLGLDRFIEEYERLCQNLLKGHKSKWFFLSGLLKP